MCTNRDGVPYTITESSTGGHVHADGSMHFNINVTFSKEFGKKLAYEEKYQDEVEFLDH